MRKWQRRKWQTRKWQKRERGRVGAGARGLVPLSERLRCVLVRLFVECSEGVLVRLLCECKDFCNFITLCESIRKVFSISSKFAVFGLVGGKKFVDCFLYNHFILWVKVLDTPPILCRHTRRERMRRGWRGRRRCFCTLYGERCADAVRWVVRMFERGAWGIGWVFKSREYRVANIQALHWYTALILSFSGTMAFVNILSLLW